MSKAQIIGVGMTPFGRHYDSSVKQLTQAAVASALKDAGISPEQVDAVFFANATQGILQNQTMVAGQVALLGTGIHEVPVVNVENACASGSSAFKLATTSVRAGESRVALAVGVEKMNIPDSSGFPHIFTGAYDQEIPGGLEAVLAEIGGTVAGDNVGNRSIFMDIYSAWARGHMEKYGTTQEQIAAVAAKNHAHAVGNEYAFFRKAMTIEDVLGGRNLLHPLTVPMCAPLTDGAAAVVVAAPGEVKTQSIPIEIQAVEVATSTRSTSSDSATPVTRRAAQRAYERSGLSPEDVDVTEVHDATAFGEIQISENLGYFAPGDGGPAALQGETSITGSKPINLSGGLESKGHPIGATGLSQISEVVRQLRGQAGDNQLDSPQVGLCENGGGFLGKEEAVAVVSILSR